MTYDTEGQHTFFLHLMKILPLVVTIPQLALFHPSSLKFPLKKTVIPLYVLGLYCLLLKNGYNNHGNKKDGKIIQGIDEHQCCPLHFILHSKTCDA